MFSRYFIFHALYIQNMRAPREITNHTIPRIYIYTLCSYPRRLRSCGRPSSAVSPYKYKLSDTPAWARKDDTSYRKTRAFSALPFIRPSSTLNVDQHEPSIDLEVRDTLAREGPIACAHVDAAGRTTSFSYFSKAGELGPIHHAGP